MGILDSDEKYKDDPETEDLEPARRVRLIDRILLNRWNQLMFTLCITAVIAPILVVLFVYSDRATSLDGHTHYTCLLKREYKIGCGRPNISEKSCRALDCCYDLASESCHHSAPTRYVYKWNSTSQSYFREKTLTPLETNSLPSLNVSFHHVSPTQLLIKLYNPDEQNKSDETIDDQSLYWHTVDQDLMGINVFRKDTNETVLTTVKGPIVASQGYWEWTLDVSNETLFGLGRLELKGNETLVFYGDEHEHSTPAAVIGVRNGFYQGAVVMSQSAFEIRVLESKLLVLRSITNSTKMGFTIGVAIGPKPADVVHQLREFIGIPASVPYWGLGLHICRDSSKLTDVDAMIEDSEKFRKQVNELSTKEMLPYESECIHEKAFSLSSDSKSEQMNKLTQEVDNIRADGRRFVMSIPSTLEYNSAAFLDAEARGILYAMPGDKQPFSGLRHGQNVTYVAYDAGSECGRPDTLEEWFVERFNHLPASDGLVLTDTWAANDNRDVRAGNWSIYFPYLTKELNDSISTTIPYDAHVTGFDNCRHIETHSLYMVNFTRLTYARYQIRREDRATEPDAFVLSAVNRAADGIAHGAHVQTVNTSWQVYKQSLVKTVAHSMFGSPMFSVPVCGSEANFDAHLHEELCIRWYITASSLSLVRVSSVKPLRDPLNLPTKYSQNAVLLALRKRYTLMPYMYTILQTAQPAPPLVRPIWYEFPDDKQAFHLDEQYMLGDALLVAQYTAPHTESIMLYLPSNVTWYEYWAGQTQLENGWLRRYTLDTDWIMYIAGGHIIPTHNIKDVDKTAEVTRLKPLTLNVALECNKTSYCVANGKLYISRDDDGAPVFLNFQADNKGFNITNIDKSKRMLCDSNKTIGSELKQVKVYGIDELEAKFMNVNIDLCLLNGDVHSVEYDFN